MMTHEPFGDGLLTDLYELTMLQTYHTHGMNQTAVFEMHFRDLGPHRNYLLAAGLDSLLEHLENLRFDDEALAYLRSLDRFTDDFIGSLGAMRFTGDVWALPEGTVLFPEEPIVQVVAALPQAQVVETMVLNQLHVHTLIASKAARIVEAAAGRRCVDFGFRRCHGLDAAGALARGSHLAGFTATSNVRAGTRWSIPTAGTMAHSFVQAHDVEADALLRFAESYPEATLLIDTYDTLAGADRVIELARRLGDDFRIKAVRLDSGDLGELARQVRRKFDDAGLDHLRIVASGGLDEYEIKKLVDAGAPIDGFGVGTHLAVSDDEPHLDCAYKLVEYAGEPRTKLSTGKRLLPGRKQVFRAADGDTIARFDEKLTGEPLLVQVMAGGKRTDAGRDTLPTMRQRVRDQLETLPDALRSLDKAEAEAWPVHVSEALAADYNRLRQTTRP